MDHFYVSNGHGNDTTGTGTEGAPYATVQKALDQTATTPNATTIHIGNSAEESVTTAWSFLNGAGNKWTISRPLKLVPWDEGTNGIYYRTINGIETPEWRMQIGTAANGMWTSSAETPAYCHYLNGRVDANGNTAATLPVVGGGSYNYIDGMVVVNSDGIYGISTSTGSRIVNCAVVTTNGTNYPQVAIYGVNSLVEGCWVDGANTNAINCGGGVRHCIMQNWAVSLATYQAVAVANIEGIENNVFFGNAGNADEGIEIINTSGTTVVNNIFCNLDEAVLFNTIYDGGIGRIGGNAFYNCVSNYSRDASPVGGWDWPATFADYTDNDIDLTEDPFVDSANDDFRLKPDSPCRGRGITVPFNYGGYLQKGGSSISLPSLRMDIGAYQTGNADLPFAGWVA